MDVESPVCWWGCSTYLWEMLVGHSTFMVAYSGGNTLRQRFDWIWEKLLWSEGQWKIPNRRTRKPNVGRAIHKLEGRLAESFRKLWAGERKRWVCMYVWFNYGTSQGRRMLADLGREAPWFWKDAISCREDTLEDSAPTQRPLQSREETEAGKCI